MIPKYGKIKYEDLKYSESIKELIYIFNKIKPKKKHKKRLEKVIIYEFKNKVR